MRRDRACLVPRVAAACSAILDVGGAVCLDPPPEIFTRTHAPLEPALLLSWRSLAVYLSRRSGVAHGQDPFPSTGQKEKFPSLHFRFCVLASFFFSTGCFAASVAGKLAGSTPETSSGDFPSSFRSASGTTQRCVTYDKRTEARAVTGGDPAPPPARPGTRTRSSVTRSC